MKQLLRRVVIKDGVAIKQLPYVMEHDAVKAVFTENEIQTINISPEYRLKHDIEGDTVKVFHLTIKWVDGETSNITVTEVSGDELFNFAFVCFENMYNAEIDADIDEIDDAEDEDAEEEIEEEMLDEKQMLLAFPNMPKK